MNASLKYYYILPSLDMFDKVLALCLLQILMFVTGVQHANLEHILSPYMSEIPENLENEFIWL